MAQISFEQLRDELFDAIVNQMEANKKDISYNSSLSDFGDSLDWVVFLSDHDAKYHIPYTHSVEDEQLSMRTILDLVTFYAKNTDTKIPEGITQQSTTNYAATLIKNAPDIVPTKVIHEDSNLDKKKNLIFIRLVYLCELKSKIDEIRLQEEEHSEFRFINSLEDLSGEKISPFLIEIFNDL